MQMSNVKCPSEIEMVVKHGTTVNEDVDNSATSAQAVRLACVLNMGYNNISS